MNPVAEVIKTYKINKVIFNNLYLIKLDSLKNKLFNDMKTTGIVTIAN